MLRYRVDMTIIDMAGARFPGLNFTLSERSAVGDLYLLVPGEYFFAQEL